MKYTGTMNRVPVSETIIAVTDTFTPSFPKTKLLLDVRFQRQ
jgi:hypothetical protein